MKGYIVYSTYRVENDISVIYLFGRLENQESFLAKVPFMPYFYIKQKDLEKARKICNLKYEKTDMKDFDGNVAAKIFAQRPQDISSIRKEYENNDIVTYESDIGLVQKYFMDMDILGTIEINGDYEKGHAVQRIYDCSDDKARIESVKPYDVDVRTLVIDIETDKEAKKIYSISIYGDGASEVHMITDKDIEGTIAYKDEKALLKGFSERIVELDPDIITGWNVVDFDLKIIKEKMDRYSAPFRLGRVDWDGRIRVQQDFLRDSSADIPGRIVFDGIALLKQAFLSYDDYKLDTVSEAVLGENKVKLEDDFWDRFEDIIRQEPKRVAEYNLQDSKLVYDILKKKKLVDLMVKKSLITGMQLDRVKGSVASLDSLYIRKAHKRGYVCPNSSFSDSEERVKGAFVMEPKPGIYDYVGVLDFKSLYPSIMRTYNIDPLSHKKDGEIIAPNGARFRNTDGVMPEIIESLWEERDKAKKEKDDVKSYAIKIIMNSFYGVLANPNCRFYSLDIANAITSFARKAIKETAHLIEEKGYKVLYGDTDSVFVDFGVDNIEELQKKGDDVAKQINRHFDKKIQEQYKRESVLELEFEKVFKVLMLPRMRGSEGGAKKRYAGLQVKDGKEKIKVTGMEIVRRDWTELAKNIQMELLDRVFHKKEITPYIKRIVEEVKEGKHDDLLIYRKSISKSLESYTKTTPPHVRAARMLPRLKSNVISYYMTINGPEPVEMLKSSLDYDHYVEKQIKPIAETILNLFDKNFNDVIAGHEQKSLFDY